MITIAVYQHKVLPHKALVTATRGMWIEFYQEDDKNLSYLEEQVFESAYQLFMDMTSKPLYTEPELADLRQEGRAQGRLVPPEFDY